MNSISVLDVINTALLLGVVALIVWRLRLADLAKLWDEIEAIKLRLYMQEKVSPCPHCRAAHGAISGPDNGCG